MPSKATADMTTLREYPRVRPGVWLLVIVVIGAAILHSGARRAWFVGALGSEAHPELNFVLSWAVLGIACGLLGTCAWALLTRGTRKRKSWLAPLLVCAVMVGGSQVAADHVESRFVLVATSARWDAGTEEFVVHVMATPGVARALKRGELRALVRVEGYWHRSPGPNVMDLYPLTAGCPALKEDQPPILASDVDYSGLLEVAILRLPVAGVSVHGILGRSAGVPSDAEGVILCRASATLAGANGRQVGRVSRADFLGTSASILISPEPDPRNR